MSIFLVSSNAFFSFSLTSAYVLPSTFLTMIRATIMMTTVIGKEANQFLVMPAMMKPTKETNATKMA